MRDSVKLTATINKDAVTFTYSSTGKEFIRIGNSTSPVELHGTPRETLEYYFQKLFGGASATTYIVDEFVVDIT